MSQNIFDNDQFFESYKEVRHKEESYNNLIEQPSMRLLLPDINKKTVLDMGCGFGTTCKNFLKMGAAKVVGIDISEKMLDFAMTQNADANIQYMKLDMEKINEIGMKFDFVYSSLALHYIPDFEQLTKKVYDLLNQDGIFLFSQEHPMVTAPLLGTS